MSFKVLTRKQIAHDSLRITVYTTGTMVTASIEAGDDELAAKFAAVGLTAARLLGLYVDDTPDNRGDGFCVSIGPTIASNERSS